jgi:hypothetical protein
MQRLLLQKLCSAQTVGLMTANATGRVPSKEMDICPGDLKQQPASRASGALLDNTLSNTLSANVITGVLKDEPGWLSDVIWRICTRELAGGSPRELPLSFGAPNYSDQSRRAFARLAFAIPITGYHGQG